MSHVLFYKRIFLIFAFLVVVGLMSYPVDARLFGVPRSGVGGTLHYQPVEADTLRVTLSGMEQFSVVKTGERRGKKGELDRLVLTLSSEAPSVIERHVNEFGSLFFFNTTRGKGANNTYLSIHKGDVVITRPMRRGDTIGDLWVNLPPEGRLSISLFAHELDCFKRNTCGRGDKGRYVVQMTLPPIPSPLPTRCGAGNTFRWALLDGRY